MMMRATDGLRPMHRSVREVQERARGFRPRPVNMSTVAMPPEARECIERIALGIFTDMVNSGATLQETLAAVYLSGSENGCLGWCDEHRPADHATPSGGTESGPQEERIEAAYWRFDARHKGYGQWKTAPMSERDAFKAEMRNALEAEKVRAEMRLVARGWRRRRA